MGQGTDHSSDDDEEDEPMRERSPPRPAMRPPTVPRRPAFPSSSAQTAPSRPQTNPRGSGTRPSSSLARPSTQPQAPRSTQSTLDGSFLRSPPGTVRKRPALSLSSNKSAPSVIPSTPPKGKTKRAADASPEQSRPAKIPRRGRMQSTPGGMQPPPALVSNSAHRTASTSALPSGPSRVDGLPGHKSFGDFMKTPSPRKKSQNSSPDRAAASPLFSRSQTASAPVGGFRKPRRSASTSSDGISPPWTPSGKKKHPSTKKKESSTKKKQLNFQDNHTIELTSSDSEKDAKHVAAPTPSGKKKQVDFAANDVIEISSDSDGDGKPRKPMSPTPRAKNRATSTVSKRNSISSFRNTQDTAIEITDSDDEVATPPRSKSSAELPPQPRFEARPVSPFGRPKPGLLDSPVASSPRSLPASIAPDDPFIDKPRASPPNPTVSKAAESAKQKSPDDALREGSPDNIDDSAVLGSPIDVEAPQSGIADPSADDLPSSPPAMSDVDELVYPPSPEAPAPRALEEEREELSAEPAVPVDTASAEVGPQGQESVGDTDATRESVPESDGLLEKSVHVDSLVEATGIGAPLQPAKEPPPCYWRPTRLIKLFPIPQDSFKAQIGPSRLQPPVSVKAEAPNDGERFGSTTAPVSGIHHSSPSMDGAAALPTQAPVASVASTSVQQASVTVVEALADARAQETLSQGDITRVNEPPDSISRSTSPVHKPAQLETGDLEQDNDNEVIFDLTKLDDSGSEPDTDTDKALKSAAALTSFLNSIKDIRKGADSRGIHPSSRPPVSAKKEEETATAPAMAKQKAAPLADAEQQGTASQNPRTSKRDEAVRSHVAKDGTPDGEFDVPLYEPEAQQAPDFEDEIVDNMLVYPDTEASDSAPGIENDSASVEPRRSSRRASYHSSRAVSGSRSSRAESQDPLDFISRKATIHAEDSVKTKARKAKAQTKEKKEKTKKRGKGKGKGKAVALPVPKIVSKPKSPAQDFWATYEFDGIVSAIDPENARQLFKPKTYYNKDLDYQLENAINAMAKCYRNQPPLIANIFKANIMQNTNDEPRAPRIDILNDVDHVPTPPLEFKYSNQLWHGDSVPPINVDDLVGCDCEGSCDPESKTCSCLLKQHAVDYTEIGDDFDGFVYNPDGTLKDWTLSQYPIHECNYLCNCGPNCINRVVQNGRRVHVNLRKTVDKGWGVFAGGTKTIKKGTYLGIYAGELITDTEAEERGMLYNKFGRTYLLNVDFYHIKKAYQDVHHDLLWSHYVVDAFHAGNWTRYMNHHCDPNVLLAPVYVNEANIDKPLLAFFAHKNIKPNEEICFSYYGLFQDEEDEIEKRQQEGVWAPCRCGAENCRGVMWS